MKLDETAMLSIAEFAVDMAAIQEQNNDDNALLRRVEKLVIDAEERAVAKDEASRNETLAAKWRAEIAASEDGKPEGTLEALQRCATMIDTYYADLFPANEQGQIHFARAMMESVSEEIKAFAERQVK